MPDWQIILRLLHALRGFNDVYSQYWLHYPRYIKSPQDCNLSRKCLTLDLDCLQVVKQKAPAASLCDTWPCPTSARTLVRYICKLQIADSRVLELRNGGSFANCNPFVCMWTRITATDDLTLKPLPVIISSECQANNEACGGYEKMFDNLPRHSF